MKKGFPHKFLWFPIGWSNLGRIGAYDEDILLGTETVRLHSFCKTRTNIGKDSQGLFKFCPRCLVKIT